MERTRVFVFIGSIFFCFLACQSPGPKAPQTGDSSGNKPIVINPADNVPEDRKEIKTTPVDQVPGRRPITL